MQHQREALQRKTLQHKSSAAEATATEHCQSQELLSTAQVARLNCNRLDKTLQAVATHACWQKGLAIWDHSAALRGNLMRVPSTKQDMEALNLSFQEAFGYDPEILANKDRSPAFLRPCTTKHGGVCANCSYFSTLSELTSQFDAGLQRGKLGGSALLVELQPAGVETKWFVLAGVCLRPLCHSLISLFQTNDVLRPLLTDGCIQVGSMRQRLAGLLEMFKATGRAMQDFRAQAHGDQQWQW